MSALRQYMVEVVWEDHILTAMMLFTDQMSAIALHQTAIIGSFFDAKHQMETQRLLQKIRARTHKDYHPSHGLCTFGSSIRSLAASERKSELTAHVLGQRFQSRMLGNANSAAAQGPSADRIARLDLFRRKLCDPMDNSGSLDFLCEHDQDQNISSGSSEYRDDNDGIGASNIHRMNKDIDYLRTVDYPWTLDVDFTNTDLTDDEADILALADNLYGNDVFLRPKGISSDQGGLKPYTDDEGNIVDFPAVQQHYMDARALLAKLSVAKNSYDAITSMKAKGTPSSREYLEAILKDLGIEDATGEINNMEKILGSVDDDDDSDNSGPSYHAQMEILTKKIYQNPDFYTNLYDKPANVERKKVAMQAIGLMQKFDLYKSYLRYEATLSVLLEMAVIDLQERIDIKAGNTAGSGDAGGG